MTMNLTQKEIIQDLHAAENICQMYEKKYGVLSEYFYAAYINGLLGDDNPDFAEWSGFYKSKLDRELRYLSLILEHSPFLDKLRKIKFDDTSP